MALTFLGDSITVGTGEQFPEAVTIARVGASAEAILAMTPERVTGDLVISAGSNNLTSSPALETTLRAIRARARGRVLWILPANAARASVVAVAGENGDPTVTFDAGPDGVHPRSYRALAADVLEWLEPTQGTTVMRTSVEGLAEIAGHEGIVLSPYRDSVGVWTIFIGHTKAAGSPDPETLPRGEAQPLEVALEVYRRDIVKYEDGVNRAITVPLAQHQFDALVSFHYNTGRIGSATLTRKINAGDMAGAVAEFDKWHRPPEVKPRRDKEKRLFAEGVYSNGGMTQLYPADAQGRVQWSRAERVNILDLLRQGAPTPSPRPQPDDPGPAPETGPEAPQEGRGAGAWAARGVAVAALASALYAARKPIWKGIRWLWESIQSGSPKRQAIAAGIFMALAVALAFFIVWVW